MPVGPDIVVTKADSPEILLAVEVKAAADGRHDAEAQIKKYLVHRGCPGGMLVTPEDALFFRNLYVGYESDSIERIGHCRTSELLDAMPDAALVTESYLVRRVEQWLEDLPSGSRRSWPPSALEAIETYVLPLVRSGIVRAAGPRWRRTGS
jgi:hypothetical protein